MDQTNEQNPTTSKHRFKFAYNYFPFTDWAELYLAHQKSMEVILSVGSLTYFEEKIVAVIELKFVCQANAVVVVFFSFLKSAGTFFSYLLSNWQVSECDRYM